MTKKPKFLKKEVLTFVALLIFIASVSYIIYKFTPEKIVEKVGDRNAYILLGLFAFLGGTSILFPFPYYLFTISFGAAGLNPLLLGICAGLGTLLGDATTYYLAYSGRKAFLKKHNKIEKISKFLVEKHPNKFVLFAFIYATIIPLSDDILMIPAGLAKYPFKKLAIGAGLGKIVLNTIFALAGLYGWNLIT